MYYKTRDVFIPKNKIGGLEEKQLERFVHEINFIIDKHDTLTSFCQANEIIDLNNFKKLTKAHLIIKAIADKYNKPFVFVINKN